MNHTEIAPSVARRHRISALPSPLKSRTPMMCQSGPTMAAGDAEVTVVPFISHIDTAPSVVRRNTMSDVPSPLKSPVPAIFHSLPATPAAEGDSVVPFTSQNETAPSLRRHTISLRPSLLRSPNANAVKQPGSGVCGVGANTRMQPSASTAPFEEQRPLVDALLTGT